MGHYAAEMLGVSDDEAKDHVPTGFIVTHDFRVMTAAKARQALPFIQYLQAPRFPDEAKAKKAVRAATLAEISRLEAQIVDLKRGLRNRGKRHG